MSAEGVQFPIDRVRSHAGSVQQTADAVGDARAAIREVVMDTQAYGQLCQFLPAILSPVFAAAINALDGSRQALQETADGLRAAADATETTDVSGARRIAAAGALPELPL